MSARTAIARQGVRALALSALGPRVPVPVARRIVEIALSFPPPPRGTRWQTIELGGVRCEEVRPAGADDATRALLYLHGGGFMIGSARAYRALTGRLARAFGAPVIVPDYRLAPEHPWPAPLDDARAARDALATRVGERLAIAGDSAGGWLALQLSLERAPRALGLVCPWLDATPDLEQTRQRVIGDVLLSPERMHRFASATFPGPPPASPSQAPLQALPPTVVHTAGEDTLRDDGETFVSRAREAGVVVVHERLDGLWHDPHLSAALLGGSAGGAPARMAAELRRHVLATAA